LLALPVALALAGFAGYKLAHRALAPVEDMARQAERITSERLHARLPTQNNDDELGHLARVFNTNLGRLEQSFDQLRRFTPMHPMGCALTWPLSAAWAKRLSKKMVAAKNTATWWGACLRRPIG